MPQDEIWESDVYDEDEFWDDLDGWVDDFEDSDEEDDE